MKRRAYDLDLLRMACDEVVNRKLSLCKADENVSCPCKYFNTERTLGLQHLPDKKEGFLTNFGPDLTKIRRTKPCSTC